MRSPRGFGRANSRRAGAILLALVLGGCATGPTAPLYSPLETAKTHGYVETRLDERHVRVTYVAPRVRTYAYPTPRRDRDADAQIALAYDLALWRSAELSLAAGYPAFRVVNRTNDVRYDTRYGSYYPPYYQYGYPFPGRHHLFDPYPYYGDYGYADLIAQVTLEVVFEPAVPADGFDARTVVERMRSTYPGYSDGAPAGPPPGGSSAPTPAPAPAPAPAPRG